MKQVMSNFDSDFLTCEPALFPAKNSPNSAKSNRIFPRKGRGDGAFILVSLDSRMADIFLLTLINSINSRCSGFAKQVLF